MLRLAPHAVTEYVQFDKMFVKKLQSYRKYTYIHFISEIAFDYRKRISLTSLSLTMAIRIERIQ